MPPRVKICVRLIGHFIRRFGFSEKDMEVPAGCTSADLVTLLGMDGLPMLVARDGEGLRPAEKLRDGDRVVIAPMFSGG